MYIIVTGASRGIGKSLAYKYAKEGYNLLLTCEKNIEVLNGIKTDIEKKYGRKVYIKKGLLEKSDIPEDTYILINNAGKCDYNVIQDITYQKYKEIIETNLDYTFLTTKNVCDTLIKNRNGIIINISSMWGIIGASCESVYSMTKGGINAFTKSLAKEFKESNVDVVAFALGAVDTDMNSHLSIDEKNDFEKTLVDGKMYDSDFVSSKIYDIIANKRYLSGDIIELNNGLV